MDGQEGEGRKGQEGEESRRGCRENEAALGS